MRIILLGVLSLCLIACDGDSDSGGKKKPAVSVTDPPTALPETPAPVPSLLLAAGLRADAISLERPPTGSSLPSSLKPPMQP